MPHFKIVQVQQIHILHQKELPENTTFRNILAGKDHSLQLIHPFVMMFSKISAVFCLQG